MKIESLFERDIFRPINGVVKADQLDESSVWQELDEFVVTRELDQHLRKFISAYGDALQHANDPGLAGNIGIWVSGFFGSGKSHFIKVLSYPLRNQTHTHAGQTRQAVDFFQSKIKDALLFGDIQRAVASHADVILFNIDAKADHRQGRDAILALVSTLGMSQESAEKWVDGAEGSFALTVENFCKWVREYLDSEGPNHRLLFLVDEVGQFIGTDSHQMLNLQTITEELGTVCQGRAWIVVTSQEDIDAVVGEMKKSKANDFSKIQGRFKTQLSLSSTNVDEVIQARLLAKRPQVHDELKSLFQQKGDILKHRLSFVNCGMTFRNFRNEEDFVENYPFAPYQFQLVQKVFEAIRNAGATGLHLSRGERSVLDAFQTAGKRVALQEEGILVPLYDFYPAIESFLDTAGKKTIDQARDNPSLELPFDIALLQVLFLIRYVEEMKGTVDNLVTLCLDEIDADRLALRRKVEASLQRLEKETLIRLTGDVYSFLTNEERNIDREIKSQELNSGDDARLLGELIFNDVLKEQRKHRYSVNKMDFTFNRLCDLVPVGNRADGGLLVAGSKQVILHEMIEKRYSLRPYGWPENKVLLLLARLLVLGEISLMLDSTLIPPDKVYDAITTPAKRRKIVIIKRQTSDPKAIQIARALGKELFQAMGPDGEDPLFSFLQNELKGWQTALAGYQPLAATGNYPGRQEIDAGLALVRKQLAADASFKFVEEFNAHKNELLDLADSFRDLEHFYEHQKPIWERLHKAFDKFQLNRLELARAPQAGPALARMQEVLAAPSPYGLIKDAETLIAAVGKVNTALVAERRQQAAAKIDEHILVLSKDIDTAHADGALSTACLKPLELLGGRIRTDESLAHITQAEVEALKAFDSAIGQIEAFVKQAAAKGPSGDGAAIRPALKPKRVIEPAGLVESQYLETQADIDGFLDRLRRELETAIKAGNRIEIR